MSPEICSQWSIKGSTGTTNKPAWAKKDDAGSSQKRGISALQQQLEGESGFWGDPEHSAGERPLFGKNARHKNGLLGPVWMIVTQCCSIFTFVSQCQTYLSVHSEHLQTQTENVKVSTGSGAHKCKFIIYSINQPKIKFPDQNHSLSSSMKCLLCSNLDPNSVANVNL